MSGGGRMKTEPGAQVKPEQGHAKRQGLEGCDTAGIVMGLPIFFLGLCALCSKELWWVGTTLLIISVGLFIPSRHYEWGVTRVIGFTTAVLVTGVSVALAALAGFFTYWLYSNPDDEFGLLGVFAGGTALAGFGYALGCTVVLLKKLEPETKQTVAAIIAGVVVGLLLVWLMYLLHFFE
jgi:hypothetical protein